MTNEQFIKTFGTTGKAQYQGSLYRDNDGNIYSYGTHFPLLFAVILPDKTILVFKNIAKYSTTTAKHVSLARANHSVILRSPSFDYKNVLADLNFENDEIAKKISLLKRRGTQKEESLLSRQKDIALTLASLNFLY
jgi:hypothetical protein